MQRFRYPPAHGLVADAYMAQHTGDGRDRRDRRSVFVHLIGLCAALELHAPHSHVRAIFRRVLQQRADYPLLSRSQGPGGLTVLHMVGATDLAVLMSQDSADFYGSGGHASCRVMPCGRMSMIRSSGETLLLRLGM
jgi:hypothetical protein